MEKRMMNLQLFADDNPDPNAGGAPDQPDQPDQPGQQQEKTYTQHEFDAALAKKLKGMPSKDEMAAYREWAKKQKPPEEKGDEAKAARIAELEAKVAAYENRQKVTTAGVSADFADFVAYQAAQGVTEETDFDASLTAYLEAHPQYKADQQQQGGAWGMKHGSNPQDNMDGVERAFYNLNPTLKK